MTCDDAIIHTFEHSWRCPFFIGRILRRAKKKEENVSKKWDFGDSNGQVIVHLWCGAETTSTSPRVSKRTYKISRICAITHHFFFFFFFFVSSLHSIVRRPPPLPPSKWTYKISRICGAVQKRPPEHQSNSTHNSSRLFWSSVPVKPINGTM